MAKCEFSKFVDDSCGHGSLSFDTQCIVIGNCKKDIKPHLRGFNVVDSSLKSEMQLIFARAGVFEVTDELIYITICPLHRERYGIRWTCGKTRCSIYREFSGHSTQPPKGNRGVNLFQAKTIFFETGKVIPVGSPICPQCRQKISSVTGVAKQEDIDNPRASHSEVENYGAKGNAEKNDALEENKKSRHEENDPQQPSVLAGDTSPLQQEMDKKALTEISTIENPCSWLEEPLNEGQQSTIMSLEETDTSLISQSSAALNRKSLMADALRSHVKSYKKMKLNDFLESCGLRSISKVDMDLSSVSERTRRRYIAETHEIVVAVLETLSPSHAADLWEALRTSDKMREVFDLPKLEFDEKKACDENNEKYIKSLAETYDNASSRNIKRQVLSIIADQTTYKQIRKYLPGLTKYMFCEARKHRFTCGRGVPVVHKAGIRTRIDINHLDHFLNFITSPYIVQDLPFGERFLKLSSGEAIHTPNVIRVSVNERIIDQYLQYCQECEAIPLSKSTLRRILSACSASVRKSLQGLDYFISEGGKAFDDLLKLVDRLIDYGIESNVAQNLQKGLKSGKSYLKSDFKVNVASSRVPDHCCKCALNDPKDSTFRGSCDHTHDLLCVRCEELKTVLSDIRAAILNSPFESEDEKDDALFVFQEAVTAIESLKAHQLRVVNQDKARSDVIDCLSETNVLLIQDWAMKFLPRLYRESQGEWYGKRGISWHVAVALRKKSGELETQAFIHIVKSCAQDSACVTTLMEHVLTTLKRENPEIENAFFRQDNAGCYHSANTVLACKNISKRTGISIQRIDFSDPQGGKGPCDRFAATVKNHVRSYVNEGHDVVTTDQFQEALLSHGGVPGARIALLPDPICNKLNVTMPGISKVNNFEFTCDGIKVWRAYQVGEGKLLPWSKFEGIDGSITVVADVMFSDGGFRPVKPRKATKKCQTLRQSGKSASFVDNCTSDSDDENEKSGAEDEIGSEKLFTCPKEGCIKTYQRYGSMVNHTLYGQCVFQSERESLMDTAKILYCEKLLGENSTLVASTETTAKSSLSLSHSIPVEGWALRSTKSSKPFSEKQKRFLEEKFTIGEKTGRKLDPVTVARQMRVARGSDGQRQFAPEERLSSNQIQGFFSRRAKSQNQAVIEAEDDFAAAEVEDAMASVRNEVIKQTQLIHPVTFDGYNLCDFVATGRLCKLTLPVLRDICCHFELEISSKSQLPRRKAPFVEILEKYVRACSCFDMLPTN